MNLPSPETPNIIYHCSTGIGVLSLMLVYAIGAWLRSYVAPPKLHVPVSRQLAVSLPTGLVTMPLYAKNAFPALTAASPNLAFDLLTMIGYVMLMGMLSRETLDRVLKAMNLTESATTGS